MNKEFTPYEIALALKELGFDEPCLMRIWWLNSVHKDTKTPFEPHITINGRDIDFEYSLPKKHPSTEFVALKLQVPTFSQAFRWFREKYDISSYVDYYENSEKDKIWYFIIKDKDSESQFDGSDKTEYCDVPYFKTYEEAELACLKKLINIVKNGK
jgi:hypothetical protein